jgi:hypothetical protein
VALIAVLAFAFTMLQRGGAEHATPNTAWDVRGNLTKFVAADATARQNGILGFFIVEGAVEPDTTYAQAAVTVTVKTKLVEQHDRAHKAVTFDSLRVGQKVQVRFAGPAGQSFPVQATASRVTILK